MDGGGEREGGRKRGKAEEIRQGRNKRGRADEGGREGGKKRGRAEEGREGRRLDALITRGDRYMAKFDEGGVKQHNSTMFSMS